MNGSNPTFDDIAVRDRTPAAIRADNLIRQRLRIGDPRDPREVAEGLKRLFPKDAGLLAAEAEGFAVVPYRSRTMPRVPESMATGAELNQAIADIDRDLVALTGDHRLKGISAELQGWGQAIRSIVADGAAAARLALDPRARDRLFGARRQLCDYSRLARLVGALTQTMNQSYRRLAQSLDEVAGLLLVLAGEALAGAGLGGGRFLLSVPASELQARRDAVLLALRTLSGTTEQAYGNDQWPWGLQACARCWCRSRRAAISTCAPSSRSRCSVGSWTSSSSAPRSTTCSASRAWGDRRPRRAAPAPPAASDRRSRAAGTPPVTTFLKAIQLFLDAFRSSRSGYRLLFVARAPIAFYGLAGIGGPDAATHRLIELVVQRGRLAELLDCYLGCDCCGDDVICQILLDKILYDTDRAIDLYTLGSDPDGAGEPEWRAAAFAALIIQFFNDNPPDGNSGCLVGGCFPRLNELIDTLGLIRDRLAFNKLAASGAVILPDPAAQAHRDLLTGELCLQRQSDRRLEAVIATLSSGCVPGETVLARIEALIDGAIGRIDASHGACPEVDITLPPTTPSSLELFHDLREQAREVGLLDRRGRR